jgi:hypothetical protein
MSKNHGLVRNELSLIWGEIVEHLSLSQYYKVMGGDMSYKSKAERVKKVSKSTVVWDLADRLILAYEIRYSSVQLSADNADFSEFDQ